MNVTVEDVKKIASLSMLELTEEKENMLRQNLNDILAHAQKLDELNTQGVEPTTYILKQQNVVRQDTVTNNYDNDSMLANAPQKEDGAFVVPKVV